MKDYANINRKWWNTVTPTHSSSRLYSLPAFKKGRSSLQSIELEELGNVKGKKLLHLMCHFGMDTLSWARNGADVTGVDLSDESIALANKLSQELQISGRFICSDVYKLPSVLDEEFDIIYTSYGVLLWLFDIDKWAEIIHRFLKKNGIFYIVELHPFTNILSYDFKIVYKYFDKGPYMDDSSGTYTDWNADIKGITYQWSYTISDVINALTKAGLTIEYIHEFPYTFYEQFPDLMKQNSKGQYIFKDKKVQIPLLFSIKATK